jgi:hypothetical protein
MYCVLWERHNRKVQKHPDFSVFMASHRNFAVLRPRTYVPWNEHFCISLELLHLYRNSVHTNTDTDKNVITAAVTCFEAG